jgi:hypothetical protein
MGIKPLPADFGPTDTALWAAMPAEVAKSSVVIQSLSALWCSSGGGDGGGGGGCGGGGFYSPTRPAFTVNPLT